MKKLSLACAVFFGVVLAGLMLGGTGCGGGSSDNANVSQGKTLLAEGKGDDARDVFTTEVTADPESCGGRYGRMLADVQSLSKMMNDYLITGSGLFTTTGLNPNAAVLYPAATTGSVDVKQYVENLLKPFMTILTEMEADADKVAELDCTFQTDSYPVTLYSSTNTAVASAEFSGTWTKAEALLAGASIHMMLGLFDFISAHDMTVSTGSLQDLAELMDIQDMLSKIQSGAQGGQLIAQARAMGGLLEANPDFLTKDTDFDTLMAKVPKELAEALSELAGVFDALAAQKVDPAKAILGYIDTDGNGFDAGDELTFGIKQLTMTGGAAKVKGLSFVVPDQFTRAVVENALAVVDKAREALVAATTGGTSPGRFGLSDFTMIISVLTSQVGAIVPSMSIPTLPDVIELDLTAFFTNPKPLRDFLPAREASAPYDFIIESEVATDGGCFYCWMANGTTILQGDNAHFSGANHIANDCIAPLAETAINPLPYIAFSDPSFNGVLYLNLNSIADNVTGCTASDPSGYNLATQYSLNKLLASLMVTATAIPEIPMPF